MGILFFADRVDLEHSKVTMFILEFFIRLISHSLTYRFRFCCLGDAGQETETLLVRSGHSIHPIPDRIDHILAGGIEQIFYSVHKPDRHRQVAPPGVPPGVSDRGETALRSLGLAGEL
jgi:hypothetical protein